MLIINDQEEERKGGKKGRLLGIITLSDVLRYLVGDVSIGEAFESQDDPLPTPSTTPTATAVAPPPPPQSIQEDVPMN